MKHLLIRYIQPVEIDNHVDPNFTSLTYGDSSQQKVTIIKNNVKTGSYIFFHTFYGEKAYISAYFYVEKVLDLEKNQAEITNLRTDSRKDKIVILGNRNRSKILTFPLPFNKFLVDNLSSLKIDWGKIERGQSELKTISDSTRTHRILSSDEVDWLIGICSHRG